MEATVNSSSWSLFLRIIRLTRSVARKCFVPGIARHLAVLQNSKSLTLSVRARAYSKIPATIIDISGDYHTARQKDGASPR